MLRILIASPYPAMRAGLRALLADASRGTVTLVGEADSIEACLDLARAVARPGRVERDGGDPRSEAMGTQPQIVIFDLALDDEELSGLWRLRAGTPALPVLALADANAKARVLLALQAGARGCLPKTAGGAELLEAARRVAEGESILHPSATATLLDQLRSETPVEPLTAREADVLRHVAAGLTNKAIALRLGISEHTVKFHLGSAMSKLGAASRAEAVAVAMRRGLIAV